MQLLLLLFWGLRALYCSTVVCSIVHSKGGEPETCYPTLGIIEGGRGPRGWDEEMARIKLSKLDRWQLLAEREVKPSAAQHDQKHHDRVPPVIKDKTSLYKTYLGYR